MKKIIVYASLLMLASVISACEKNGETDVGEENTFISEEQNAYKISEVSSYEKTDDELIKGNTDYCVVDCFLETAGSVPLTSQNGRIWFELKSGEKMFKDFVNKKRTDLKVVYLNSKGIEFEDILINRNEDGTYSLSQSQLMNAYKNSNPIYCIKSIKYNDRTDFYFCDSRCTYSDIEHPAESSRLALVVPLFSIPS